MQYLFKQQSTAKGAFFMEHLHVLPEGYKPSLDLYHTQLAIKQAKDDFEEALAAP